ncbi:MAG TPA: o-succinylbenzoate synthase [bacterium]|nr:o-succinylbenzoate synthase [bacterium]
MKIKKGEVSIYKFPTVRPFVTSFGKFDYREIVIVKLTDEDGVTGYGEASSLAMPVYTPEFTESVIWAIKKVIFPTIKGVELKTPFDLQEKLGFIKGNNFAKTGVEVALFDLYGKKNKKRLIDIIGGSKKDSNISATVSIHDDIEGALAEVKDYYNKGIRYLKVKVKPGFDYSYLKAISDEFKDVYLMLDANSGYKYDKKNTNTFKKIDKLGLYSMEQPLATGELIEHSKLQKELKSPISLDESIDSVYSAQKAIELKSCRQINIKFGRLGGINNALKVNSISAKNKVDVWIGGMLESPVGFYVNLALSTLPNIDLPVDFLGALSYIKDYEGFFKRKPYKIKGNKLRVDIEENGLGLELNWKKINNALYKSINL